MTTFAGEKPASDAPERTRDGLRSVQAGRGIAAMLVVLFHVGGIVGLEKYWGFTAAAPIFEPGRYGVHFFFVLSGFIILWIHERDVGRPDRLVSYAYKRVVRIYPPYWAALALVAIAPVLIPSLRATSSHSPLLWLQSIALFGARDESVLAVGWTLFHEILFYAAFALLVLHRSVGTIVLALWFAACLIFADATYATSSINLLFALGMMAAWLLRRTTVPAPAWLLGAGIVLFAIGTSTGLTERGLTALYGVAAFLILLGGVALEQRGRLLVPGLFTLLGDASYSIYLVQFLALSAAAKLLSSRMPVLPAIFVLAVIATIAGLAFHLAVEKPLLALLRRRPRLAVSPIPAERVLPVP